MSGKNPGKLGVFWWLDFDPRTGTVSYPDSRSFDTADVWEYLSEAGYRSAVLNVPMTYPPIEIEGTMVSGFGAPFEDDPAEHGPITHPPEFESELRDVYDWQIGVENITTREGLEVTYDLIRSRFDLLLDLLEGEFQYLHLTLFYINMLQHKYGDGAETRRGWELIDEYLGELLDEDALMVLYSDHGHSTIDHTFVVNRWLLERGYLTLESRPTDQFAHRLYSMLSQAGVSPKGLAKVARDVLPDPLSERLLDISSPTSTRGLFDRVVWEATDAVAFSQGPLYLNAARLGTEYEAVRSKLRAELDALTADGVPVLADVHRSEDVYHGPYADRGPDLLLESADGWEVYGGLAPSAFETNPTSWTSGNHPVGMVALDGTGVRDTELSEQSILDIAPTVLASLDCAVPSDMDGTPIEAAFSEPLDYEVRDPIVRDGRAEAPASHNLGDRLADLGYLD